MQAFSVGLYLGFTLIAGLIGYYIVQNIMVNDYEIKNVKAALLFSLVFALSCDGFMLLIFEVLGVGLEEMRLTFWTITLGLLVYMSILVIPSILIYKTVRKISQHKFLKIGKTSNQLSLALDSDICNMCLDTF